MVKDFWDSVFKIYQKISSHEVQSSVIISILNIIPGARKTIKTDILHHMTTAAKTIIARKWWQANSPTIVEWICEMNEIQQIETRIMTEEKMSTQKLKIWEEWEKFRSSADILKYVWGRGEGGMGFFVV